VAEEAGLYEVHDCTVSVGLCNIVTASGCGSGRDRHSAVDVGGMDTASAGLAFANISTTWASLTSGMTCPCVIVSHPSVGVLDDGSPNRGLSKEIGDDVNRISIAVSEGNEGKGWVAVVMPSKSHGRCREVEPMT
jgi:hypothetical protein